MDAKIYHWGPLLYHNTIIDTDLFEIGKLCHKNKDYDFRGKLAGHLDNEYSIDEEKFIRIINDYVNNFNAAHKHFYGHPSKLKITKAWVNFMKSGEFNPLHRHDNCDFSGVLYLSMPDEIIKENENWNGNGANGPGMVSFVISTPIKNFINERVFLPKRGDIFIFPKDLLHMVSPFKSDVERISVAFNLAYIK